MPELPEVETTCQGIKDKISNSNIKNVVIRDKKLRYPVPLKIKKELINDKFTSVTRRGKYLILQYSKGAVIIHLGMSGKITIINDNQKHKKHDHFDIEFNNGNILRYNDPRKFGCILYTNDDPLKHKLLNHLGPEPLTNQFSGKVLFESAKRKTLSIKQFIMDSKVVVGVGNIYANEALFNSKISPYEKTSSLNLEQFNLLAKEIKKVLKEAIKQGGTTLKDFLNSDGKPGYFIQKLKVYGRGDLPCYMCSSTLVESKLGQRTTVHCPNCQK